MRYFLLLGVFALFLYPDNPNSSLFGKGINPIFGDRKARAINDILMIHISETHSLNSNSKKKVEKKSSMNFTNPALGKDYNDLELKKDYSATNSTTLKSDGKGNNSRDDFIQATVMAKITNIYDNNSYRIEGIKTLNIDGETTTLRVSGIVRSIDINSDNSVASKYLADSKISFISAGELSDATHDSKGVKNIKKTYQY